jgi:hypothetical protein
MALELHDEPYLLPSSGNGIVTLNNCNQFNWWLSDYLGLKSILYPDTTLN